MSYGKISAFFEMIEKTGDTLCFDGECLFCRSMMHRWRGTLESRGFELVPLQAEWVRRRLNLPETELMKELRVITPDGRVLGGTAGLVHLCGKMWWVWPVWLMARVPGGNWLRDGGGRWGG